MKVKSFGYNIDAGLHQKSVSGQGVEKPTYKSVESDPVGTETKLRLPLFNHRVKTKKRTVSDVMKEIKDDKPKALSHKGEVSAGIDVPKSERFIQEGLERMRENEASQMEVEADGRARVQKLK